MNIKYFSRVALTDGEMQAIIHAFVNGRIENGGDSFKKTELVKVLDWANEAKVRWEMVKCILDGFGILDFDPASGDVALALNVGSKRCVEQGISGRQITDRVDTIQLQ